MQQNRISDNFQYIYVDTVKAVLTQWLKWFGWAVGTVKFELTIRLMQEIVSSGNASKKFREQWERYSHPL